MMVSDIADRHRKRRFDDQKEKLLSLLRSFGRGLQDFNVIVGSIEFRYPTS